VVAAGVLISGTGSNLKAIIDRVTAGTLDCDIRLVVSNRRDAGGLAHAESAHLTTRVIDHKAFSSRDEFDRAVVDALRAAGVELVVLAGFDRLITKTFVDAFPLRIMNIHPALLPAFPGLHAQRQAAEYGVKIAGATVHFVDEHTDHGPIIIQGAVAVRPDDSEDDVRDRILAVEHDIYPRAIQLFAEGRLEVDGRRVRVHGVDRSLPPPLVHW
jgi:phosphoribosylglycinamide formyltransferase-1